jgi:hypothetical protein
MPSKQTILEFLKHLIGWMAWAGVTVVIGRFLIALTSPGESVVQLLNDLTNLRSFPTAWLPGMATAGLLMTTLEALGILKRDRFRPGRRLGG